MFNLQYTMWTLSRSSYNVKCGVMNIPHKKTGVVRSNVEVRPPCCLSWTKRRPERKSRCGSSYHPFPRSACKCDTPIWMMQALWMQINNSYARRLDLRLSALCSTYAHHVGSVYFSNELMTRCLNTVIWHASDQRTADTYWRIPTEQHKTSEIIA